MPLPDEDLAEGSVGLGGLVDHLAELGAVGDATALGLVDVLAGDRTKQGSDVRMVLASLYGTWRLRGLNPFGHCRKLLGYHQL